MGGTALYEAMAVLIIAQVYGIDLSFGQQMLVTVVILLLPLLWEEWCGHLIDRVVSSHDKSFY